MKGIFETAVKKGYELKMSIFSPSDTDSLKWSRRPKRMEAQMLKDWLREEKGIHIASRLHEKYHPTTSWKFDGNYMFSLWNIKEKQVIELGLYKNKDYYQALEKAIEEAIKLI